MKQLSGAGARTRRRIWATVVCGLFVGVPSTASAHYLSHGDANDTRQRLDLRIMSLRLHRRTHNFMFKAKTYSRFHVRRDGYIYADFDSYGDHRRDYSVKAWYDPGGVGEYVDWLVARRSFEGSPVRRFAFRSRRLIVKIDANHPDFRRTKHLRWRVRTTRFDRFLIDRAPEGGAWFLH
jgi:hypothetical protein